MIDLLLAAALAATAPATEIERFPAAEAHQGVVADARFVYAISNAAIGKYDRRTHRRVAEWRGDPARFVHMNSCSLRGRRLVCALSNYPAVPMESSVEWFDLDRMEHLRTHRLGRARGSLTWISWHAGSWWACFAHYDGRGGEPGRDHRSTVLVRYDRHFAEQGVFRFPDALLGRFAPYSSSGGAWGRDGLLYVTGHDRPELYALRLPESGDVLEQVATIATPTGGQAIAWDSKGGRTLWSIDRAKAEVVASKVPAVAGRRHP
ncbi:hypothetical protein [Rhizorhabdus dicambivorans]|uniref:Uncharacterized protein n=1 Tax=Rhizorhabdus dicambivorans TaxID=1850238 RepID=A0A2A4FTN1_9SPHN|nr:hypothetical protein [Rhizorhabdus dicambivorans]ATE66452.1 hypothetical protein CMV14_20265 [Rhizorhabdus dicambivorans]PCE41056.1 hypothetical protein COO09_17055 [Rhizorhabdus dicambivorans]